MSALKDRLTAMIRASGPISVATYMDLCLHDRHHGYYATRPGLGRDFITAPEISQIFGELIGVWAAQEWQALGAPNRLSLVEIGPGRGTLMKDALRAASAMPGFSEAAQLHFIEPSPVLQDHLAGKFETQAPIFLPELQAVPADQPALIIANEWLDCLPVQQYVRVGDSWHERVLGLSETEALTFGLSSEGASFEPEVPDTQTAYELQPGLKTVAEALQSLFDQTPGRALLIDYGRADAPPGDTLRSYKDGQQIDPLAAPGDSDLTCDVDFGRLERLANAQSLLVNGPVTQSEFLLKLGAEARLNQLAKQHPDQADALFAGIKRLVDPEEMGTRFLALCLSSPGLPVPTAF